LLVVIAIIGILVALLLPAIQAARESARRTQCANNIRQYGIALQSFHNTYRVLPPARWNGGSPSWLALLMPFMEGQNAFDLWDFEKPYRDPANQMAREVSLPTFFCPSRRAGPMLSAEPFPGPNDLPGSTGDYAGCVGDHNDNGFSEEEGFDPTANGVILTSKGFVTGSRQWSGRISFKQVTDGLSKTIFCGEKHVLDTRFGRKLGDASIYNGDFIQPYVRIAGGESGGFPIAQGDEKESSESGEWLFGSSHPQVAQFGLCDGSVQVLTKDIDTEMFRRLGVRDDGEVVSVQ
jgi:hypothetical protein